MIQGRVSLFRRGILQLYIHSVNIVLISHVSQGPIAYLCVLSREKFQGPEFFLHNKPLERVWVIVYVVMAQVLG